MKNKIFYLIIILCLLSISSKTHSQSINVDNLKKIRLKTYLAEGLMWKGESAQNTNWNKICETPDGKIWFCGGDHWGSDAITGPWDKSDRYERLWGFGNATVCYYEPKKDKVFMEFELDKASSLYSNAESPGHGKIHANITTDSKGNIYTAGYLGSSYIHEYTQAFFPKSYVGSAVIKYNPASKNVEYLGTPFPYCAIVAVYYDEKRNIVNGITVEGRFWRINLTTRELNRYESVARMSRLRDRVREMIMDKEGACYFANDVGGLTKFDPDTQKFTDIDITLPGKTMDFRASVVSSKNIIYCITTDGFVWSYAPNSNTFENLGHVLGMSSQPHYTPNIALDDEWNKLYFLAGNHGGELLEKALGTLTILDIKEKKYHWIGTVEGIEGSFGAVVAKNHSVYFSSFGSVYKGNELIKDKNGRPITRPYLLRYDPPENLESLK